MDWPAGGAGYHRSCLMPGGVELTPCHPASRIALQLGKELQKSLTGLVQEEASLLLLQQGEKRKSPHQKAAWS